MIDTEYEGYSKELITDESSPLLHYIEARQIPRHDALAEPELSYRIAEVKVPLLYDLVMNLLLDDFSHNHGYPEDDPNWEEHRAIDPSHWGAETAYQLILDRRIGQYHLPEGTFVVALGNTGKYLYPKFYQQC